MEAVAIIARGTLLAVNYVLAAAFVAIIAFAFLLTPAFAMGADERLVIGLFLALPVIGGAWFFYSTNVRRDRAKARFLPLFWLVPITLVTLFVRAV
ncbi:hypothetical protein [Sphingomonas sp.]|uniref:hypothetical protein n=1 Tax=Sphingomonas sp. TaxID=28214 RepID=UPI003D6CE4F9